MDHSFFVNAVITILCAFLTSTGVWAFFTKILDRKSAKTKMILGIGHAEILFFATKYTERGNIAQWEYEDLCRYLYEPYKAMGGDGSADRLMEEVKKLPIITHNHQ